MRNGGVNEEEEGEKEVIEASTSKDLVSEGVVLSVSSTSGSSSEASGSPGIVDSSALRSEGGVGISSVQESLNLPQHIDSELASMVEESMVEGAQEGGEWLVYGGGKGEEFLKKEEVEEEERVNQWLVGVEKQVVGRRKSPGKKRKEAEERREREREKRKKEEKEREEKRRGKEKEGEERGSREKEEKREEREEVEKKVRFVEEGKYKKERVREGRLSSEGWRDSKQPSLEIQCPVTLGGQEIIANVDTCADFLMVERGLWEKMEGEEVVDLIVYSVVGGERLHCRQGKKIRLVVPGYDFFVVAHPMRVSGGSNVLIPLDVMRDFGFGFTGLPKFFASQVEETDVEEWLESEESVLEERKLPEDERETAHEVIMKVIKENDHLVKENDTCSLIDSEFKIELMPGAEAWFVRQYDIPRVLHPIVKKRMQEWWDAGWVATLLGWRWRRSRGER